MTIKLWPGALGVPFITGSPSTPGDFGVFVGLHADGTVARVEVRWPSEEPGIATSDSLEIGGDNGSWLARRDDTILHHSGIEHCHAWDDTSEPTPYPPDFSVEVWVLTELEAVLKRAPEALRAAKDPWHLERAGTFKTVYSANALKALRAAGFTLRCVQLEPAPPRLTVSEAETGDREALLVSARRGERDEILVLFDDGTTTAVPLLDEMRAARANAGFGASVVRVDQGARAWLAYTGRSAQLTAPAPPRPPS